MRDDGWKSRWKIDAGSHSVIGKIRDHNEDSWHIDEELRLFAVADGLGGHLAGERASSLAVGVLNDVVKQAHANGAGPSEEMIVAAFRQANHDILAEAGARPDRYGMGTTLTAMVLRSEGFLLGHVGDSRAWRVRDGAAQQLTRDHTIVAQQVREGLIDPAEAENHPLSHILSRCLGVQQDLEVDIVTGIVAPDDIYVLASDGIYPALQEADIATIVAESADSLAASRRLVESACELDGHDNITSVVVACHAT